MRVAAVEVGERIPELLPDRKAEIVVYCMAPPCPALEKAARELAAMGYGNVRDYVGGKQDWIEHGFPTKGRHYERRR